MGSARTLFRAEVLEARRQQCLGRVQLVRPLALSWVTAGVICVALAIASFLMLGQYTRKATVSGVLVPDLGLIRLVPSSVGTVIEADAVEGQAVHAGDVLFVLSVARPLLAEPAQLQVRRSLDERRSSLETASRAQQTLAKSRMLALDRRLEALAAEMAHLDGELSLQRQRLSLAEQALARLQSLQSAEFVAPSQVQAKTEELLGLKAASQSLARQWSALQRERAEIEGERRALPLLAESAVGGLERDLAQVNRDAAEQDAEQRLVVRAPQAGTVGTVLVEPGQSVTPASALATLVPEGATLQAQLYAPGSAIGFVQLGQDVRLRYDAFPYQKFGQQLGRVTQVSRVPLASSELAAVTLPAAGPGNEPMFRITVALNAPAVPIPLVAGMRLQADVLLEHRRLIEWLFEPLLGFGRRL